MRIDELRRKRTHTLIKAWRELNVYRWPKCLGKPPDDIDQWRDNRKGWELMEAIKSVLGDRVIMGKISSPAATAKQEKR